MLAISDSTDTFLFFICWMLKSMKFLEHMSIYDKKPEVSVRILYSTYYLPLAKTAARKRSRLRTPFIFMLQEFIIGEWIENTALLILKTAQKVFEWSMSLNSVCMCIANSSTVLLYRKRIIDAGDSMDYWTTSFSHKFRNRFYFSCKKMLPGLNINVK